MRIIHLTTHLNRGGITSYVYSLAVNFKKRNHSVIVASSGGELENEIISQGIRHLSIPIATKNEISPKIFLSFFALSKFIQKEPLEIIHAHTRVTQVVGELLSKKFKIPLVTTCHGFFKPRLIRRKIPCWGDRVIAISQSVKEHLIRDFNVREDKIRLIYNGVNTTKLNNYTDFQLQQIRQKFYIEKGSFVVGTISRLSDIKGLDYLLRAAKIILSQKKDFIFLIIGSGKQKDWLMRLTYTLGIQENVRFIDTCDDCFIFLSLMDLFVMPSLQEGLGLAILEAQLRGVAVIASNVGGIPEIVRHNLTGILVKPKDEHSLANAILNIRDDIQLRLSLADNAKKMVLKDFTEEKMIEKIELVYKELL